MWKSVVAGAALLAAILVALGFFWPFGRRPQVLRLPGVVEIQEVRLGSKIGGRVAEVHTREGKIVERGELLVRFDVPELKAQEQQWRARVELLEAELEKAENGPRPDEIRQAKGNLDSAEADVHLARDEFARIDQIYRRGGSDRAEYDAARAARDRAQGRAVAARARLSLLEEGTRTEDIAAARANLAEVRGKLHEVVVNLREAEVRAPERVVIEVLAVRVGDLVPANQPIIRVLRADDLWVKVYVPETELGKIHLDQAASVTMDTYPGRRFAGVVMQIASQSEFTPRNVQSIDERRHQVFGVKVRVEDPEGIFKSGMAAEVTFDLSGEHPADQDALP
jgi:multidrug resistance efflux pump